MKNIYLAWKAQHQKSMETPQKRSQSDESTHERVEVQQTSQSQSMSEFEASQPKEKLYTVQGLGYMTAEQIRAEAQSDDIGHFTTEEFKRALTADEFREVFGEPQQAQTPQKQSRRKSLLNFLRQSSACSATNTGSSYCCSTLSRRFPLLLLRHRVHTTANGFSAMITL